MIRPAEFCCFANQLRPDSRVHLTRQNTETPQSGDGWCANFRRDAFSISVRKNYSNTGVGILPRWV